MSNADLFLSSYNEIEQYLRRKTGENTSVGFSRLIDIAGRSNGHVSYYKDDLRQYSDLRNAIVHDSKDGQVIAEPHFNTVEDIQQLADLITDPPSVIPLFQIEVLKFEVSQPIADAVTVMQDKSYSQVPVYVGNRFTDLLTTNTITRWLGASVDEGHLSLKETLIRDVLVYTEYPDHYTFFNRNADIFEVVEQFRQYERMGRRLEAIIVTQRGSAHEKPIGIITAYDLPKIQEKLDYRSKVVK
jgi:predicted transcriptional regulator